MLGPLPRRITSGTSEGIETSDARALAIGRAHEPDRGRRQPGLLERRAQHVVDERRDGAQRRAARAQDRRVQALQQLAGDVERDVRPRLEVRADGADRDPPLVHDEAVRERARADLALERLERGGRLDLRDELVQARVVEAQPVERPLVETARRSLDVRGVRLEHLGPALAQHRCRRGKRIRDRAVVQPGRRLAGSPRLLLDLLANRHCLARLTQPHCHFTV